MLLLHVLANRHTGFVNVFGDETRSAEVIIPDSKNTTEVQIHQYEPDVKTHP